MKKLTTNLLLFVGLLAMTGCASEDNTPQPQPEPKVMTEFAMVEEKPASQLAPSRTAGEYTGTKLKFYWTAGDKLFLNNGTDLQQSVRDNLGTQLVGSVTKVPTASFWFAGTFSNLNYPLRYTGKNGAKDKVTIAATQTQPLPADASHIGESGDCGTATATKSGNHYDFTLEHKAAYFTLTPFTTDATLVGGKLTKIKITANKPIAGTFDFDDSGLNTANAPASPSNSITLNLKGADNNGFTLPAAASVTANAATIVLPPGTYSPFKIEYTVTHPISGISATTTMNYPTVKFNAGKNKKLAPELAVTIPVHYLYSDGTTAPLAQAAGRTPIGVVIIEKTADTQGTAIALNDAPTQDPNPGGPIGTTRWGDGSNIDKSSDFNVIYNDMNGSHYTWDRNASINNVTKGETPTCYAFYTAAKYNPGPTITGTNISKWYLPAAGEFLRALELLGRAQKATAMEIFTKFTLDWNYLNSFFTAAGGTALQDYWYHTSSEVSLTKSVTIVLDGNASMTPSNKYSLTDIDDKGPEYVRPFIHF